jgi:hypothetical protein
MARLPAATQATFKSIEEKINKAASRQVKAKAKQIADTVVRQDISPVYSGAYIESFSIKPRGSGGGRMKLQSARKKSTNPQAHRDLARDNLYTDIEALGKGLIDGFVLRNRSKHSRAVEDGLGKTPAYKVFARVRFLLG